MKMPFSFDLISEPWIPCVDIKGQYQYLGLKAVLVNAHKLYRIQADVPPTTASVLCLLLAILYRNFGPENEYAWRKLWEKGRFDEEILQEYLEKWRERFDLFHSETPFYQRYCTEANLKTINNLLMHVAFGTAATLFSHETENTAETLTPAEAALALITNQLFGLAGLCNPNLGLVYTDAPCARGAVLFLAGETLFETLMFNLVRYDRSSLDNQRHRDRPAWEAEDVYAPERTSPLGYLDFLTWQSRRIMLMPEWENNKIIVRRVTMAPGLTFEIGAHNPFYFYFQKEGKEKKFLRFRENREFWRDSGALLFFDNEDYIAPYAINWIAKLKAIGFFDKEKLQILALGMSTDPGKHKIFFYRAEQLSFPIVFFDNTELSGILQIGIGYAELASSMLRAALNKMATLRLSRNADRESSLLTKNPQNAKDYYQHWESSAYFWDKLKKYFFQFVEDLPKDSGAALSKWNEKIYKLAWQAFEYAVNMSGEDGMHLKAVIRAKVMLYNGLKQLPVVKSIEKEQEEENVTSFVRDLFQLNENPSNTVQDVLYKYVSENDACVWNEMVADLIADLFSIYPKIASHGNMGSHLHAAAPFRSIQEQYIEERFLSLLLARDSEILIQLPKVINLLKARGIKVNWAVLFFDLLHWHSKDMHVQKKWAESFWGYGLPFPVIKIL